MADEEQLAILRQGVWAWNDWRREHPIAEPDLEGANLFMAKLSGAKLSGAKLSRAKLHRAKLVGADLVGAKLVGADLLMADLGGADLGEAKLHGASLFMVKLGMADLLMADLGGANLVGADLGGANLGGAKLDGANLSRAKLDGANLVGADLSWAALNGADLGGADLGGVKLNETILADLDLSSCKGLDSCVHSGPSIIDHRTLQRSGALPQPFLRGVGLPDNLIDYLPSLLSQPIQFYNCFISYSSKDQVFANRLHADLQAKGVRCWFAPHDMRTGDRIRTRIDEVIRIHQKLLLILSANAIASDWVEKEVEAAFERERETGGTMLFPIRLDAAVMERTTGWAADIKRSRHITDFTRWKRHDTYQKGLDRLLRDLKIEEAGQPSAG